LQDKSEINKSKSIKLSIIIEIGLGNCTLLQAFGFVGWTVRACKCVQCVLSEFKNFLAMASPRYTNENYGSRYVY